MRRFPHFIGITQGRGHDCVLVVMDQDDPLPGAHGYFPYGSHACLFEELSEQGIGFIRVVRNEEPGSLEVVRIRLKEVHELVKLDQLCRHGFCRIDLLLVEDETQTLKVYAVQTKSSMHAQSQVVEEALREFFERHGFKIEI